MVEYDKELRLILSKKQINYRQIIKLLTDFKIKSFWVITYATSLDREINILQEVYDDGLIFTVPFNDEKIVAFHANISQKDFRRILNLRAFW